jgi:hypothetical protein
MVQEKVENISWEDFEKNKEVLHITKDERNILRIIQQGKSNWIGRILRMNCVVKHIIGRKMEERIEVTGRRGKRRKHLLDDLKETRE